MSADTCPCCPPLEIIRSVENTSSDRHSWETIGLSLESIREPDILTSQITIIYAQADKIRDCPRCKNGLTELFKIPDLWWSQLYRRSNGYFGVQETVNNDGHLDGYNTWLRFMVKQILQEQSQFPSQKSYIWYKVNVFTRWTPNPNRSLILLFDPLPIIKEQFLIPLLSSMTQHDLSDPFFIHTIISEEVARLQDEAVWAVRNLVRDIETQPRKSVVLDPNYRYLHDISRHAIHVCETIQLAIDTADSILTQHDDFVAYRFNLGSYDLNKAIYRKLQHRMESNKNLLIGLQHRAGSIKERIMNEIQLAFNLVAQYDSQVSVQIGHATQTDSSAMKIAAFVTLTFFPSTAVATIFGMSFFDYDASSDEWTVSKSTWIFWLVATVLTCLTALVCSFWYNIFPPKQFGEKRSHPI